MMLSDMGAEVLTIDRVVEAERSDPQRAAKEVLNRGRRRIAVNLKSSEGEKIALRLIDRADVLLEGYRPGVMERLGLGPKRCLQRNPKLIYGRMTGWGQEGPLARAPGHDINYIALTGALHAIGRSDQAPVPPLNLLGDFGGGGMLLAFGVVCALLERTVSGEGQVVDAAIVDGASLLMSMIYGLRAAGMWKLQRGANLYDSGAPFYEVYECKDGNFISVGALEPKFYVELLENVGINAQLLPAQMDREGWPALKRRLAAIFKSKTREEWCALLEGSEVCFAPVLSMREAMNHAHMQARETFIEIAGVPQARPAPRFSRTSPELPRTPSTPGEHTEEVLIELGFSKKAIFKLRENNVIL
jgi:alpha-methylacyl-CoA racemase